LLAARAYESSLHEESVLESARRQASETTKRSSPDVRIREFYNGLLHPGDKQIFREFALKNYSRNLLTQWEEEEVEYLVMVEQDRGAIVGLLVMVPYDINAVHIRLMVVDGDHRKRGLGTQMLMHVAAKHASKKVTLNVDFDRPELLGFYVLKGYARLEDVSMEHRVMMLALNHAGLIARIPLPDLP
jgi:GNAT superfamily N-acetyltransferase